MYRSTHVRTLATSVAVALVITLPGADVAVGQDDFPITLRLAVADGLGRPSDPYVNAFVAEVSERSGGSLTIEPVFDAGDAVEPGFERGTARLLVDGGAELALAASRAWDHVGVTSLNALQAPFLIDSDELALAVAQSDVATDLLADLADVGVTGLAMWPEDLRHPAAFEVCTPPLVAPSDFEGLTIRAVSSTVTIDLLTELGAIHTDADGYGDLVDRCEIQGAESGFAQGQSLDRDPTFTGDVTFFPKFQVLAANTAAYDRLSDEQQQIVRDAAAATRDLAVAEHWSDVDAAAAWCEYRGRVVLAGPDAVVAFQAAAAPVVDALAADPVAGAAIEAIRQLKETITPASGVQACGSEAGPSPTPVVASPAATAVDGTWIMHLTFEELETSPLLMDRGEVNDDNWGDFVMTLDKGTLTLTQHNERSDYKSVGTYTVDGDQLVLMDPKACCPVHPHAYRWHLEGDTLTLTRDPGVIAGTSYIIKPWTRVP